MSRFLPAIALTAFLLSGCPGDDKTKFEIGRAAKQQDLESLKHALESADSETRCYAAKAISRIRNKDAVPLYLKTLDMVDCGWKIPSETSFRLEEVGERDASPALVKLLDSEDERIRVSAARALGGLHWTHARDRIRELSQGTENERAKSWYEWSLCRLAEPPPDQIRGKSACKRPVNPDANP